MTGQPELSVIIPCLNEAENVPRYRAELFSPLAAMPFDCELNFSDGGSSDGTPGAIREAAAGFPWVKVIEGQGRSSFAESISRALDRCSGSHIALMEADLSFSPLDLPRLLDAARAGNCDCVCGSPFLGGFTGLTAGRLFLTYGANILFRLRFGLSVTSYTQIFKVYRADSIRKLRFKNSGFALDAELTAKCLASGYKVSEVPVTMTARGRGSSKMNAPAEILASLALVLKGVSPET